MKLRIGSKIRVKYENAHVLTDQVNIGRWVATQIERKQDLLLRVKKLSGGKIYLTPIHVAQQDADTKSWCASAKSLQLVNAETVEISVLGVVKS